MPVVRSSNNKYDRLNAPQQNARTDQQHDGSVYAEADDGTPGTYAGIRMMPLEDADYAVPAPAYAVPVFSSSVPRPAGTTHARPASDYAVPTEQGLPVAPVDNSYAEPDVRPLVIRYNPTAAVADGVIGLSSQPDYSVPTPLAPVYRTVDKQRSAAKTLPGTIAVADRDLYTQVTTLAEVASTGAGDAGDAGHSVELDPRTEDAARAIAARKLIALSAPDASGAHDYRVDAAAQCVIDQVQTREFGRPLRQAVVAVKGSDNYIEHLPIPAVPIAAAAEDELTEIDGLPGIIVAAAEDELAEIDGLPGMIAAAAEDELAEIDGPPGSSSGSGVPSRLVRKMPVDDSFEAASNTDA